MNRKNINLRTTIWMELFVFITLIPSIIFAIQVYDLDEFDDLEKKSLNAKENKSDNNNTQRLILFDDNLYLLDDDFDFGDEELELLKLELNPENIEIAKEYENFLNDFFEHSTLIRRPSSAAKSNPQIIKEEESIPSTKNQIDDFTPTDPNSFNKPIPPIIKQEESIPSTKNQIDDFIPTDPNSFNKPIPPIIKQEEFDSSSTSGKQVSILPRIGYGLNRWNGFGIITGGSVSYGRILGGKMGADLMYLINERLHTFGLTLFYERIILQYITLKGGVGYLKTGTEHSIGGIASAGLSFSIGKMFIIQPMAGINFGSIKNNIMGINLNMGISLGKSQL